MGRKKKVLADYHGLRYTREIDGELGQWKIHATAAGSQSSVRTVNWNADLVDDQGHHQTSALSYPFVGMQSQHDRDYVEYQILSAKSAGIDGFMVEWGFPEHKSNKELPLILEMARQYRFEIGITWCDGWHFYDWINEFYPEIKSREDKVEIFKQSLQYLLDHVYAAETGILYEGHPLIFLFGGGPNYVEFDQIKQHPYLLPEGMLEPWFAGRAPMEGDIINGRVEYHAGRVPWQEGERDWSELLEGMFGWVPIRVREGQDSSYASWDRYATKEDCKAYLEALQRYVEEKAFPLRISSVCPEMDNRGCASWGKGDLSHIPRDSGATYEAMWQSVIERKEDIDIAFVVTWNDFTEMTQIEPTLDDQGRELRTTAIYAAKFKGCEADLSGLALPVQLFYLRKNVLRLRKAGVGVDQFEQGLNEAAMAISTGNYKEAADKLLLVGEQEEDATGMLDLHIVRLEAGSGLSISGMRDEQGAYRMDAADSVSLQVEERATLLLRENYWEGFLHFEYMDDSEGSLEVLSDGDRPAVRTGDFSIVCNIQMSRSGNWKKARVRIYKENCSFKRLLTGQGDFQFNGYGWVRNISLNMTIYCKEVTETKEGLL